MADAVTEAGTFIEDVLGAVQTALESGDTTTLEADLEAAVADFADAIAGGGDETPPAKTPAVKSADGDLLTIVKHSGDEERMIWGWASVITQGGKPVVDRQDDIIELPDLKEGVYDFMKSSRRGDEGHRIKGIGTVVESLIFSEDIQKALGIDLGLEGWFVGVHVEKESTWTKVKSGELRSFSMGGAAERIPIVATT